MFKALNEKIAQESLQQLVMEDITKEYRSITDIVQSLSLLDITIGYLVSVGTDANMRLTDFMREKLTLKKKMHSEQVGGAYSG